MSAAADIKKNLRRKISSKRARISSGDKEKMDTLVQQNVINSQVWHNARCVGLYAALPQEISTHLLIRDAWADNKTVALPKITDKKLKKMIFTPCASFEELQPGAYGILEPSSNQPLIPDLLILPGIAFDLQGNRLGSGGGYYDRFLFNHYPCVLIGVCYNSQIIDNIPQEPWDSPVDAISMEKALIWI